MRLILHVLLDWSVCCASEMATSVDVESVVLIQGNNSISVALEDLNVSELVTDCLAKTMLRMLHELRH